MRTARSTWAVAVTASCFGMALSGAASSTPSPAARAQGTAAAPPVSFNRDIRPILANNCFACHGPDEKQRETKFHFDTEEGAFAKAGVIERGNSAESLLIEMITHPGSEGAHAAGRFRVRAHRPADRAAAPMDRPGGEMGYALGLHARQRGPSRRPVSDTQWVRNPIDRFILARLEREGLKPSPRRTR